MLPPLPHASQFNVSRRGLLLAGLGTAVVGCVGAPPPPVARPVEPLEPVLLTVTLVTSADVNPDIRGRPSPIAIRVFELRSTAGFESADFFSLYERDQATLTSEALARDQFIMKPGETQSFTRKANSDARYLGVLAAYRDLEHSAWRATAAIAPPAQVPRSAGSTGRQQRIRITVNRAAVNIEVAVAS